jgi:hypothetical protein
MDYGHAVDCQTCSLRFSPTLRDFIEHLNFAGHDCWRRTTRSGRGSDHWYSPVENSYGHVVRDTHHTIFGFLSKQGETNDRPFPAGCCSFAAWRQIFSSYHRSQSSHSSLLTVASNTSFTYIVYRSFSSKWYVYLLLDDNEMLMECCLCLCICPWVWFGSCGHNDDHSG